MADPTTSTATGALAAVTLLSLLPGVDPAVVLGAFSGAVVFVMASDDLTAAKKVGFFLPSFFGGLLTAGLAAGVIASALPGSLTVSPGVGALLSSAVVVKILLWLLARDPSKWIAAFRGGAKP